MTDESAGPVQQRRGWWGGAAILVTMGLALACGSGEETDEPVATDAIEFPEDFEPRDTGVLPPREDAPRRDRGRDREDDRKRTGQKIKCLGVQGKNIDADIRLVFDGMEVVGGSLSFVDKGTQKSALVEPLTGQRTKDRMTATGPGKQGGTVELQIERADRGMSAKIDGTRVEGRLKVRPCGD